MLLLRLLLVTCLLASFSACALGGEDAPEIDGESDLVIGEGTLAAFGLIEFINHSSTTEEVLDDEVGLNSRAAVNIIERRAEIGRFETLAELDDVSYVGTSALAKMLAYAQQNGWVPDLDDPAGVFDGVEFSIVESMRALRLVNRASESFLSDEVDLASRAVASIIEDRPVTTMAELADLYYVGKSGLERIKGYGSIEVGIISDLDRTLIPPNRGGLPDAGFPGAARLLIELERLQSGGPGDTYYVTARDADGTIEIPDWLETNSFPSGPIASGVSGVPWLARPEKFSDISAIFDRNRGQSYILFGDTNHVDPDAYQDIVAAYPDRVRLVLIHFTKSISAERLEGFFLFHNYAEAAEILLAEGELGVTAARRVMKAAQREGLDISDSQIEAAIERAR